MEGVTGANEIAETVKAYSDVVHDVGAAYNRVPYDDYMLADNVHRRGIRAMEAETPSKETPKEKRKEDDFSE